LDNLTHTLTHTLTLTLTHTLTLTPPMKIYFDHEELDAYKKALAFATWSEAILERIPKSAAEYV